MAGLQEQLGKHLGLSLAFCTDSKPDSKWPCLQGQSLLDISNLLSLKLPALLETLALLPLPVRLPPLGMETRACALHPEAEPPASVRQLTSHPPSSCSTTLLPGTLPSTPGHHWPLCSSHRCEVRGCGDSTGFGIRNRGPSCGPRLHQGPAM